MFQALVAAAALGLAREVIGGEHVGPLAPDRVELPPLEPPDLHPGDEVLAVQRDLGQPATPVGLAEGIEPGDVPRPGRSDFPHLFGDR